MISNNSDKASFIMDSLLNNEYIGGSAAAIFSSVISNLSEDSALELFNNLNADEKGKFIRMLTKNKNVDFAMVKKYVDSRDVDGGFERQQANWEMYSFFDNLAGGFGIDQAAIENLCYY